MHKTTTALLLGILTGVIDVIPMLMQGLSWDANLSAFSLWVVTGYLIATSTIDTTPAVKGIIIAFLVLLPNAFIIGWHQPMSLIPIVIMTLFLGALLGYSIEKYTK